MTIDVAEKKDKKSRTSRLTKANENTIILQTAADVNSADISGSGCLTSASLSKPLC